MAVPETATRAPGTDGASALPASSHAGVPHAPEPSIDPDFRLDGEETPRAVTPAARSHDLLKRVRIVVLLLVLGAAAWWAWRSGWLTSWNQPQGPVSASGTLEADEVLVAFEVPGRIVALAQEGQEVQADEVVAKLDDSLIQTQILQATTAQLQQLQIQADRYLLRAPMAGVVTRVAMHVGEVVTMGTTVLAIADLDNLDLTAYVLERDLGAVQVGQEVTITADPFPGRTFRGIVTSTNPRSEFTPRNVQTQADRLNLVFGVKIRVENPDRALKPGMPADVIFPSLP